MCNPFLHHVHVELHIQYNICVWLYRDDAKRKAFPTVYLSCNDNKGASNTQKWPFSNVSIYMCLENLPVCSVWLTSQNKFDFFSCWTFSNIWNGLSRFSTCWIIWVFWNYMVCFKSTFLLLIIYVQWKRKSLKYVLNVLIA